MGLPTPPRTASHDNAPSMPPALVTAGATRNPVDAIRYLSAGATGTTGIRVARELSAVFPTTLLGSEEASLRAAAFAPEVDREIFGSTRDLLARMETHLRRARGTVLVHSAAVGDYEAEALATKIPSGQAELVIRLRPAPKIIDLVRIWDPDLFLCSFKAGSPDWSDDHLEEVARAQLQRTRSNLVFANRIGQLDTSCMLLDELHTTRFVSRELALSELSKRLLSQA